VFLHEQVRGIPFPANMPNVNFLREMNCFPDAILTDIDIMHTALSAGGFTPHHGSLIIIPNWCKVQREKAHVFQDQAKELNALSDSSVALISPP
jgi:hypothetical protein